MSGHRLSSPGASRSEPSTMPPAGISGPPSFLLAVLVVGALVLTKPITAPAHDPSAYGGLFRSRDGGATWFPANPGRIVSGAMALAVSPVDPNHLLLATDSGLLRSRNAGLDWVLEAPALLVGAVFAVAFHVDGRRAIAASGAVIARSDDGQRWHRVAIAADALPPRLLVPGRHDRVYLVGWRRVYVSDDWGISWNELAPPPPETAVTHMLVAPGDETVYALAGVRLWVTGPARGPWRPADAGLPHGAIDVVAADAREPRRLWATATGQVFRSDDNGETWKPWGRPVGESSLTVRGLAVSTTAREIVLTTDRGLYRSADAGDHWELPGDNLPAHLEAWPLVRDPSASGTLYAGFALTPYAERWRLAAERTTTLARVGAIELAGSAAFFVLLGLGAAAALRWAWRHDRAGRSLATSSSAARSQGKPR